MVVCICHKATKIYCFVHKVGVCGDCICQHPICVVRTYAEWVIDGDYEWPSKCSLCQEPLKEDNPTTRLGCLHNFHTPCLEAHLKSVPANTAPAGYGCPSCGVTIWPPQSFRDVNAELPSKLKAVISQVGLSGTLLGPDANVERPSTPPIPTFSPVSLGEVGVPSSRGENALSITIGSGTSEITVDDSPQPSTSSSHPKKSPLPNSIARKNSYRPEKLSYEEDDEEASRRKYARRGPAYKQILRYILPFWSPQLPTLPITTPKGVEEEHMALDGHSRRRHHRSSAVDPRNFLFLFAILSCLATMILLYYRLIQSITSTS